MAHLQCWAGRRDDAPVTGDGGDRCSQDLLTL